MSRTEIVAEPGVPRIVTTRRFAAPPALLFRAHVEPDLLAQWLRPSGMTMTVDHLDARHGGTWRFVHRDPDGVEYAFRGVFHGTPSPRGIVQTFEVETAPGPVSLETITFEERGEGTVLRRNTVYQSVADRDRMVRSGMEDGIRDGMESLDELVAKLRSPGVG